jgi:predicted enzyme related to lactoylglutathione lyase
MGAPVIWFEISSANSVKLRDFYSKLFDWQLQHVPEVNYTIVNTGTEGAIGGGIAQAQGPNQVLFYIAVDDPQAHLDRIEAAGGKTVMPVTVIPDMVTLAQFADPDGNVIGLLKSS